MKLQESMDNADTTISKVYEIHTAHYSTLNPIWEEYQTESVCLCLCVCVCVRVSVRLSVCLLAR